MDRLTIEDLTRVYEQFRRRVAAHPDELEHASLAPFRAGDYEIEADRLMPPGKAFFVNATHAGVIDLATGTVAYGSIAMESKTFDRTREWK